MKSVNVQYATRIFGIFLACVVIGLPAWVFVLYPTEQAMNLLKSPTSWAIGIFIWLVLSFSFLVANQN